MAITTTFDPYSAAIISPASTCRPVEGFPETCLVTFQAGTFDVLLAEHQTQHLVSLQIEERSVHDSIRGVAQAHAFEYHGHTLGAYLSPIGAPGAVAVMEAAIAHGARRFVVFGTCGALVNNLPADGLILPTAAYRDEGTSYHYARSSDYMPVASHQRTAAILRQLGVPYTAGKVWTTDAFFRETEGNLAKHLRDGCIAVDMEVSALAALAAFRQVELHYFLYPADALTGAQWDQGSLGTPVAEVRARYLKIAADIALGL